MANETAAATLTGDLSALEAMSLGGTKQYEPALMSKKLRAVIETVSEEWKASGRLQARFKKK